MFCEFVNDISSQTNEIANLESGQICCEMVNPCRIYHQLIVTTSKCVKIAIYYCRGQKFYK